MLLWVAGRCSWAPGLQLCTVDTRYPISEYIAALLPDDPSARTSVLSDRTAAAAIMAITDIKVCKASIRGKGATKALHARIVVDGNEEAVMRVSEDHARAWLEQRGVKAPAQPKSKTATDFQSQVVKRLFEQLDDKELVKNAVQRLKRIITKHAAPSRKT